MNKNNLLTIALLILFIFALPVLSQGSKKDKSDWPVLTGPYLGQKPPGMTPEIFAPNIISTEMEEFGCSFSPNGKEFYFTRVTIVKQGKQKKRKMTIMVSLLGEMGWSKPEIAPFCGSYTAAEPNFSPNGDFILFGRLVQLKNGSNAGYQTIVKRKMNGWGKPRDLIQGMFSTITSKNVIYYTDVSKGHSKGDICRTLYINGNCQKPEKLGGKINSSQQDAHPFVTPEGDLLIFDSNRPGGHGDNDLYICFRQGDGSWSDPENMGMIVNTSKYDAIPYLTYDRKYFFFFRNNNIYWVNAKFIKKLK